MTSIEWTRNPDGSKGKSWNPIRARNKQTGKRGWFCAHVHDGGKFCYAERINIKAGDTGGNGVAYKAQNENQVDIYLDEETLLAPLHWKKPQRIFVCSMTDLFGSWVKDEWLDKIFAVAALCPQHTFIVLTKRPERMKEYICGLHVAGEIFAECLRLKQNASQEWLWPLPNVWGLVSCSTQEDADKFIPILLDTPLAKRGVSLEPLLGPMDLSFYLDARGHARISKYVWLDWVIAGGESGSQARPLHPDWLRSLRMQCLAARIPFFFKQWGCWLVAEPGDKWCEYKFQDGTTFVNLSEGDDIILDAADMHRGAPDHLWKNYWASGNDYLLKRTGKKSAGRQLDGVEHNEFPQQASS